MATKNFTLLTEASCQLFGEHPEDVISPIDSAAEALGWLEEIFSVIKQRAEAGQATLSQVKRLADAGAYIANNMGGYVESRYRDMSERLEIANSTNGGDHV